MLVQAWLTQLWLPPQAVHAPPPWPQAPSLVPPTQVLPTQHPLAHVVASHLATHAPATQVSPVPHVAQPLPPLPQAESELPDAHALP